MLTTVNVQSNLNAAKYGSLVAIGDAEGTVTLIELCASLYEPQSNEKLSIKQMLEREYTREKNLKAAKRLNDGKRTTRRDETVIEKQKEKMAERIRKLETDFIAQVGIVGEELPKPSGRREEEAPIPQKQKPLEPAAKVEAKVEVKTASKPEPVKLEIAVEVEKDMEREEKEESKEMSKSSSKASKRKSNAVEDGEGSEEKHEKADSPESSLGSDHAKGDLFGDDD